MEKVKLKITIEDENGKENEILTLNGDINKLFHALFEFRNNNETQQELNSTNCDDIESIIVDIFHELGIPSHIKGYQYGLSAIKMAIEDSSLLKGGITKVIYPGLSKQFNTTPSRVERAIRHSIEVASIRGNISLMDNIFKHTIKSNTGRPTNLEFISMVTEYIRYNYLRKRRKENAEDNRGY